MMSTNAALYLGVFQAVVLERCPTATLVTVRAVSNVEAGYQIRCMVETAKNGSVGHTHSFFDNACDALNGASLTDAARIAGEQSGRILADSAK
jgi:hypothetical protein